MLVQLADTRLFALKLTQVINARTTHTPFGQDFNLQYTWAVQRKNTLDANTVADLANSVRTTQSIIVSAEANPLKLLNTLFVAFKRDCDVAMWTDADALIVAGMRSVDVTIEQWMASNPKAQVYWSVSDTGAGAKCTSMPGNGLIQDP